MKRINPIKKRKKDSSGSKKVKYRRVTSTQKYIPIKDFVDGIIVTDKDEYVKILEIIPTPYFMKPAEQRDRIYRAFFEMFRTAPVTLQFKCISVPADLSVQLEKLEENRKLETNQNCLKFYDDYKKRLLYSQATGVSKRFFIIFKYEKKSNGLFNRKDDTPEIDKAKEQLNLVAYRIASKMRECYNMVVTDAKPYEQNKANMEILYTFLNRDKVDKEPFKQHSDAIVEKYANYYGRMDGYSIPATEFVSPDSIDFTRMDMVKVNDTYYKYFCIPSNGYNSYVYPGWLHMFIAQDIGVDVDVYLRKIEKDIQSSLKRTLGHASADIANENDNTDAFEAAQTTYRSARYLRDGLLSGQDAYDVCVIITISDTDVNDLYRKVESVMTICKEQDVELIEMKMQNEACFNTTLPLCNIDRDVFNKTKQNILTETAAAFYMFTSFEMNHPGGIYVGDDTSTGSLVVVDYFSRAAGFPNANIFIAGQSGAGKTYALMLMAIRTRLSRIPIIILAPEKENEFRRICNGLGGQFISVSKTNTETRINPMEIFMRDQSAVREQELIDGVSETVSYLAEKVNMLVRFSQMFTGKLDFDERAVLENCIIDTYAKFGINSSNDSLWNEDRSGFKKMPVLGDLKQTILENTQAPNKLKQLALMLTSGSAAAFNGQTNIDVNNDFIVFGLEKNDAEFLPIAIFLAMDFAWSKIKESRTKKKMLIIDEWWRMAFNPIAADYSMEIAKIVRAYSGSVCFATQNMSDILQAGNAGNAVISNCSAIYLMNMKRSDINAIENTGTITFSDNEKNAIERFEPGNCLFIAANNRVYLKFIASKNEHRLISTDNETLTQIKNEAKNREAFEKLREYIEASPDVDDLFIDEDSLIGKNTTNVFDFDDDSVIEVRESEDEK